MGGIRTAVKGGDVVKGVAFAEQVQDVFHTIKVNLEDFYASQFNQPLAERGVALVKDRFTRLEVALQGLRHQQIKRGLKASPKVRLCA